MAESKPGRRTVHWSWVLSLIVVALIAWVAAGAAADEGSGDAGGGRPTQGAASEAAPAEPPPPPWPVAGEPPESPRRGVPEKLT